MTVKVLKMMMKTYQLMCLIMMTPIGNSDWNYHITNIIIEIANDKILLIINNVD